MKLIKIFLILIIPFIIFSQDMTLVKDYNYKTGLPIGNYGTEWNTYSTAFEGYILTHTFHAQYTHEVLFNLYQYDGNDYVYLDYYSFYVNAIADWYACPIYLPYYGSVKKTVKYRINFYIEDDFVCSQKIIIHFE